MSVTNSQVRFTRNPHFHEWSHAAQPAGNPGAIVWRSVPPLRDAVTAIEHGQADFMAGLIPKAQYRLLRLHDPAQLHSSPEFAIEFAHINTHRAPFNDVRVRQALNYAINRNTIARLYGGPSFATPTCQRSFPACPATAATAPTPCTHAPMEPTPAPTWHGRGASSAHREPAATASTSGAKATTPTSRARCPPTSPASCGPSVTASTCTTSRPPPSPTPSAGISKYPSHFQISIDGDWAAPYPNPSSCIPQFFSCDGGNNGGYYCSPRLDRQMQQAAQLELTNPAKAAETWTAIDRQLTNNAIWAPTVSENEVDLVSKRLHNYEYNPVWGFLTDQSWLG